MPESLSTTPRVQVPEIDWLKGFCILCVVCIHAAFLEGTQTYRFVINRAVPVFLVLFGLTSELWWQRARANELPNATKQWFVGRFARVVPGYWAMMAAWWLAVTFWQRPDDNLTLGWPQFVMTVLGIAGWVGTSWFVTLILQYIVLFPWLRRVPSGLWAILPLAATAAITGITALYVFEVMKLGDVVFGKNVQNMYYYWVIFPRAIWHVTAGMFIARWWQGRINLPITLAAIVVCVIGAFVTIDVRHVEWHLEGRVREVALLHLLDVPLTIALLGVFRWLPLPDFARRFLGWCGRWSWGIYLAHLFIHEIGRIAGFNPTLYPHTTRAAYALLLFVSGAAIAVTLQKLATAVFTAVRSRSSVGVSVG